MYGDERMIPPKMRKKEVADVVISGATFTIVLSDSTELTISPRTDKSLDLKFSYLEKKHVPLYIETK